MANLNKPTCNLFSNIMANSKQIVPVVGMGATELWAKDRHAGTIVEVTYKKDGSVKGFIWQQDNAKRTDNKGMSDSQDYDYTPNTSGPTKEVVLRKNGRYVRKGEGMNTGLSYMIGERCEFYDFSF